MCVHIARVCTAIPSPGMGSRRVRGRAGPPCQGWVPAAGVRCSVCSLQMVHSVAPRHRPPRCHQPALPVKQPPSSRGTRFAPCSEEGVLAAAAGRAASAYRPPRFPFSPFLSPWGALGRWGWHGGGLSLLVPEPKIAGDARLPRRGSGDVTRRQSPAAPKSSAEEWERASPSIPPRASPPEQAAACAGKTGGPFLHGKGVVGLNLAPAVLGTSPSPWLPPSPGFSLSLSESCAEDAALPLMARAG